MEYSIKPSKETCGGLETGILPEYSLWTPLLLKVNTLFKSLVEKIVVMGISILDFLSMEAILKNSIKIT